MKRSKLYELARRYGHRTYSDAELDDGLVLAEARIGRDLRCRWNHKAIGIEMDPPAGFGEAYGTTPADFRAFIDVRDAQSWKGWKLRDANGFSAWLANEDRREDVCFIIGPTVAVAPAPAENTGLETAYALLILHYYGQPETLSETTAATHPAAVFPDVYVHGMLLECARLAADDAAKEAALAEYSAALDLANETSDETLFSDGAILPDRVIGG